MKLRTLICFLSCVVAIDGNITAILEDIFRSIERTLAFYERNIVLVTLDDVFALRLLEGQILIVNNQLRGSTVPLSDDLLGNISSRLTTIYQHSRNLSSTALNLYKDSQWSSIAKSNIYQWPWSFATSYRQLDPSLKWSVEMHKSAKEYNEHKQLCFSELMRSGLQHACNITRDCMRMMFARGQSLLSVQQQLLYTLMAEQIDCLTVMNFRLISSESVQKWQAELCTNIFFTVGDSISKNGNVVPPRLEGVFLNMALLCPFIGYMEFFHIDWLRQILSWQTLFGCWGSAQHSTRHLVTQVQSADSVVHPKKEEVGDKRYFFKDQADNAVDDLTMKKHRVKNLQHLNSENGIRTERVQMVRRKRGLTEIKLIRTIGSEGFGRQVPMSGVFARRRRMINPQPERTKERFGFSSERLLFSDTLDINSSLLLPGGCVAPLTAIAIGALSQYLRFCLVAPLSQINPVDYLFGTNYILNPDELIDKAGEAGLPVTVYKTQKRSSDAAAVYGFVDGDLNHLEKGFEKKVNTDHLWADLDLQKAAIKADPVTVEMAFDEGDQNEEDGDLGVQEEEEEDVMDYSFPPDDAVNLEDGSRDFGGKGTRDRGIQDGGYDSYYDNADDDNGGDQPLPWRFDPDWSDKLTKSSRYISQAVPAVDSGFDTILAISRTYAVLLGVMILFVWLLYKFLHKRKTGLVYRYSRWK